MLADDLRSLRAAAALHHDILQRLRQQINSTREGVRKAQQRVRGLARKKVTRARAAAEAQALHKAMATLALALRRAESDVTALEAGQRGTVKLADRAVAASPPRKRASRTGLHVLHANNAHPPGPRTAASTFITAAGCVPFPAR